MTATNRLDSPRARWIALVVVCLAQLMSILDSTIVNVALPHIQHDLHFSQSSLTWVLNGYLVTFGSLLLLGGRLGDLVGHRRMFLGGVTLFTLASAACGLADSQATLIVARFVQGVGGASAVATIVAIIALEFPSPKERAQAMSIYVFVTSGGGSLGLILGGVITELLNWHWIFFINLPIGVIAVVLGRMWIAERETLGIGRDVDVLGSGLITISLVSLVYSIVTASTHGWGSLHTVGFLALTVALLIAFVVRESRIANPIMPLHVFAIRGLPGSSLLRALLVAGFFATFFIGVLYLEHVRGYGPLTTGLAFLAQTVTLAILSSGVTAWLVGRLGPRPPIVAGLLLATAGLYVFSRAGADTPYFPSIFVAFVLIGAGAGLAMMPLMQMAMANVPGPESGLASGIINTSLQVSAAIATAVFGTISATHTSSLIASGHRPESALLSGYQLAFTIGTACVAAALAVAVAWFYAPRVTALLLRRPSPVGS